MRVPIADTDNVGVVYDRLMMLGGDLVLKTVDSILAGNVRTIPQETLSSAGVLHPAPKIFKDMCRIDWTKGVKPVYDFIRGLSPYPAAWTELCEPDSAPVVMKIYEAGKEFAEHALAPGTIVTDKKTYFKVASTDGFVHLLSIQFAGKKRMNVADFLRGVPSFGESDCKMKDEELENEESSYIRLFFILNSSSFILQRLSIPPGYWLRYCR